MLKFWARRKEGYRDGTMSNKSILRVLLKPVLLNKFEENSW